MKKSLIALAVAGAFATPAFAATANVDIYGILDASVNQVQLEIDGVEEVDATSVGEHGLSGSRLGFKGAEDLGGGLSAIWQIESSVNVEGTGSTIGQRNTFVGLAGGFGTVVIGNHDTPEKMSTGKLDFFSDSVGDYNASATIIDTRENNVVAYISPSFSGLTVAVAAVAGEFDGGTSTNDGFADHFSASATYENGPIYLAAAFTSLSEGYNLGSVELFGEEEILDGVGLPDTDIWRLGAGYSFGNLKLAAVYQNIDIDGAGGAWEDGYSVGASYTMGAIVLKGQYMTREDILEGFAVGADYNLSKRTKAYLVYTDLSEENSDVFDIDASVVSLGMRHSF